MERLEELGVNAFYDLNYSEDEIYRLNLCKRLENDFEQWAKEMHIVRKCLTNKWVSKNALDEHLAQVYAIQHQIQETFTEYTESRIQTMGVDSNGDTDFMDNILKKLKEETAQLFADDKLLAPKLSEETVAQLSLCGKRLQEMEESLIANHNRLIQETKQPQKEEVLKKRFTIQVNRLSSEARNNNFIRELHKALAANETANKLKYALNIAQLKIGILKAIDSRMRELIDKPNMLASYIYNQRISNQQINDLAHRLVIWKELNDYEQKLKPFRPLSRGRPVVDNFYDSLDMKSLRRTLEQIHKDMYQLSVAEAAKLFRKRTFHFLNCFIVALFRRKFSDVFGRITAYCKFLRGECRYDFLPDIRTFQNWVSQYSDYLRRCRQGVNTLHVSARKAWDKLRRKFAYWDETIPAIELRLAAAGL